MSKVDDFITRHDYREAVYSEAMEALTNVRNLPDISSGALMESTRASLEMCEKMAYLEKGVLIVLRKLKKEINDE